MTGESTRVLRPSAIIPAAAARRIIVELETRDVSQGGVWSASSGLWQRYDVPWNGPHGMKGSAQLVGTVGAIYETPTKFEITVYRVTVSKHGRELGWEHDSLVDDALQFGDITLAACPKASLLDPPKPDPFKRAPDLTAALHGR